MRTSVIAILALLATPAASAPATTTVKLDDSMSIICIYGTLNQGRVVVEKCGDPFDADEEARYAGLNADLESFIRANGGDKAESIIAAWGPVAMREYIKTANDAVCSPKSYAMVRGMAHGLVSASGAAEVRSKLKTPRDPMAGFCF